MALPLVESGSVAKHVRATGPLKGDILQSFMAQVASGLAHLHTEVGFMHCDIKPGNILWDCFSRRACICDFGLSVRFPQVAGQDVGTRFFTEVYRHPDLFRVPAEMVAARRYIARVFTTSKVDWWAAGCTFFEVACGQPLFPMINKQVRVPPRADVLHFAAQTPADRAVRFLSVPVAWRRVLQSMLDPQPRASLKWDEQCPKWFRFTS